MNANPTTGTVLLAAGTAGGDRGVISETAAGSVSGATLIITRAESVNLTTDITTLSASNVQDFFTVADQSTDLTVQSVTAGGAVSIQSAGTILDEDTGTVASNTITGTTVALTAATGIGTVTDLPNLTGLSVDVNSTTGIVTGT